MTERGKKILLIEPPVIIKHGEFHQCMPPLGLSYIASYIRDSGHSVNILDACVEGWDKRSEFKKGWDFKGLTKEDIKERISQAAPDIIGISWKFTRQEAAFSMTLEAAREAAADAVIVIGGAHPSSNPDAVLGRYDVDYIVLGEGEEIFKNLVNSLASDKDISRIEGLAYRNADGIVKNQKVSYIQSLDSLPYPARDLLPMSKYSDDNRRNSFDGDVREYPKTTIITSRGCPEKCTFCAIKGIWGRKYRVRSAENVVGELEELVNGYGIKEIHFLDDNLTLDKERAARIFDLIVERGLKFHWRTPNGVSSKTLDAGLIAKMKKSGCYRLSLGIESGNARILNEVIRKNLDLEKLKQVNLLIKEAGIEREGFFILGMPGEDSETIMDTINLATDMDLDSAAFFSAQPFPGTELFKLCSDKGYIKTSGDEYLMTSNPSVDTPLLSKGELKQWQRIANYTMAIKRGAGGTIRLKYLVSRLLLKYYKTKRRLIVEPPSYLRPLLPGQGWRQ